MIQEKKQDDNEGTVTTAETMEKVRKLFVLTRDLLFEGFKKKNFVSTLNEVGDLLDDYLEEDKENHGLISIFGMIAQELLKEGFFGNLLTKTTEAAKAATNLMKKSAIKKT